MTLKWKKQTQKSNENTDNSDFMIFNITKSILKQSKKTNDKQKGEKNPMDYYP